MSEETLDLGEFLERVQDDKALLLELLDIFIEDFNEKRTQMGEAIARKDSGQIKRIAHSLKGSSGNISAKPLRATMLQFEEMGKNNDFKGADELLEDMDKKFEALSKRISMLKNELK